MSEEKNVSLLREAYKHWDESKAASANHWLNLAAENVTWKSIGGGTAGLEFTRHCDSKAELKQYFAELSNDWEMLHYTVDEFIAQGDRVVMVGSCGWRNRSTGSVVETPKVDIVRMKDSKMVEFYEFFDTAKTLAASQ